MPPPGWYPDPGGGSGWRYWDGRDWTQRSSEPPSSIGPQTQKPRRSNDKTLALIVGFLLLAILFGTFVSNRQSESKKANSRSTTETTVTSTRTTSTGTSDAKIAAAARQYILESLALPAGSDFINYECPGMDAGSSDCWAPYVTKFTYHAGVLRVFMQVDRHSYAGKELGDSAAHAIMNFIKLGTPPSSVRTNVDWVETVDGTGVHIAQYSR